MKTIIKNDNFLYELLDYQFDIRRRVIKHFRQAPTGRALVHMPTGSGKTKTAMHTLQELWSYDYNKQGSVLWLAHSEELLEQARLTFEHIWQHLGAFDVGVLRLWGKEVANISDQFDAPCMVLASIQKLLSVQKRRPKLLHALAENANLVVVDECHKAAATKTRALIAQLTKNKNKFKRHPNLLGLTATPGRKKGFEVEDDLLKNIFDGVKIRVDTDVIEKYDTQYVKYNSEVEALQERDILAKIKIDTLYMPQHLLALSEKEVLSVRRAIKNDKSIEEKIINKIAGNNSRNKIILNKLKECVHKGYKTLFFACNIKHAGEVYNKLQDLGVKAGMVLGNTPKNERQQTIETFKTTTQIKILVNCGVLTTGFDCPLIDCVFIARPVSSIILYSQMLGRGLRGKKMGGLAECRLINVVDDIELGSEKWAFHYFDNYWR